MYGGKFAFQNRLSQLVVGRKFTIFALFYFVFEGKFHVQAPRGLIFGGRFNGGFFRVTILRGLYFRTFTVCHSLGSQTTSLPEFCSSEPLPPYTISTSSPPRLTFRSFPDLRTFPEGDLSTSSFQKTTSVLLCAANSRGRFQQREDAPYAAQ